MEGENQTAAAAGGQKKKNNRNKNKNKNQGQNNEGGNRGGGQQQNRGGQVAGNQSRSNQEDNGEEFQVKGAKFNKPKTSQGQRTKENFAEEAQVPAAKTEEVKNEQPKAQQKPADKQNPEEEKKEAPTGWGSLQIGSGKIPGVNLTKVQAGASTKTQAKPQAKPQGQNQAQRPQTAQPRAANKQCVVVSNQYRMKLSESLQVYQYVLAVEPMAFWDAHRVQAIIKTKRREMELALGPFVCSGQSIYTLTKLDSSQKFETQYKGEKQEIHVDTTSMVLVNMANSEIVFDSQSVMYQLLNIIIKQAFRETNLKQVGKAPRFFDVKNPVVIDKAGLQIWTGFKAAAVQSKLGTMLCMDSIFKFMCTRSCLDTINDIKQNNHKNDIYMKKVREEYQNQVIIADWGNRRSYTVNDVDFDHSPVSMKFNFQGKDISVAEYFDKHYGMKIKNTQQPLFAIKIGENNFYLPPEFCLVDGVTEDIRKSAGMRDALKATRIDPNEKVKRIQSMCKDLFSQKCMQDWGLELEPTPIKMKTDILAAPKIFKKNQIIHCDENVLRKLPIQKSVDLDDNEWILIYARRNFDQAQGVYDTMSHAQGLLGIKIGEPHWIELDQEYDMAELDSWLLEYMVGEKQFKHPKICLAILGMEKNYPAFKLVFDKYRMPSQVVTTRNARSFNASKASNIIRQMNSKCGGDLFNMQFPSVMNNLKTMLIGIDVCHAGFKSVVGFAASTNPTLSQYFSDYLVQPKGQEIVKDKMIGLIRKAITCFKKAHKGAMPTNFIIYRDGVGDSMREQVLANEIPQLQDVIKELYNSVAEQPAITVIVVNKRITQRFFVEDGKRLINPPSGCIIDKQLVENDGSQQSKVFDFYLTPANTTQGCVLPTHFYVAMNQSGISKIDLEHLTFALCHFYYNWAGPIKVPGPCQYAHKIAEFYTRVGLTTIDKQRKDKSKIKDKREQNAREQCEMNVTPINEKLHFL